MKLNQLRDKIHENAVNKGFYDDESGWLARCATTALKHAFFAQKIALIHSELSEAIEADRNNHLSDIKEFDKYELENDIEFKECFDDNIKNTVEDEIADVIIRVLDLCGHLSINIEKHIELKMRYNELREHKHGKEY
jgi:NTP pyrophosphatase (non-canonical NTP hydrolase)